MRLSLTTLALLSELGDKPAASLLWLQMNHVLSTREWVAYTRFAYIFPHLRSS